MTRRLITKAKASSLYPTPAWVTEALLGQESFEGAILEPCAGAGAMLPILHRVSGSVYASDIAPQAPGIWQADARTLKGPFDNIITNPAFPLAEELLWYFLPQTRQKVAFLLRLAFLESERRYKFFQIYPPTRIHVFSERVTMYPAGEEQDGRGVIAMAWCVWDRRLPNREPIVRFIAPRTKPR